jgi:hypothetical protein
MLNFEAALGLESIMVLGLNPVKTRDVCVLTFDAIISQFSHYHGLTSLIYRKATERSPMDDEHKETSGRLLLCLLLCSPPTPLVYSHQPKAFLTGESYHMVIASNIYVKIPAG